VEKKAKLATTDLSVVIITFNEEENIKHCIDSCGQAFSISILDSYSTDKTKSMAEQLSCNVYQAVWSGYGRQKNEVVGLAPTDWVLSLDADERLSPELIEEIRAIDLTDQSVAYAIPRKSFFLGKPVNYAWGKDCVIRIFNRNTCKFDEIPVHEKVVGYRKLQRLRNPILHHTYKTQSQIDRKIEQYSTLSAEKIFGEATKPPSLTKILLKTAFAFSKTLILRLGFLDGIAGFRIAIMNANVTYLKYTKARVRMNAKRTETPP
jgi:glycosyltransferase involved in cell wall biosynthesis